MDSKRRSSRAVWRQAGGPLVTAAAGVVLDLVSRYLIHIPEPTAIILFAVVGSAFFGGLRAGFASAGVAWMYYAWHFSDPDQPFRYETADLYRVLVLAVVTPAMAALVGVLHRRGTRQVSLQLQASEDRFKAFMDHTPAAAWMKDFEGRYVYVNVPFTESFGVRLEDADSSSVWPVETARQLFANERAILADGKPLQLYAATGSPEDVRHWWILQFPVEAGSRFTGGLAMDITERRRAEEALRHSEERYALAAHSANDGLFDWDFKSGEVYFSARWKSMLGHEENEVGTSPDEWFKRVHPEDLPAVKESVDAHIEGRAPAFECEHRMRHKERGYRWVLSRGLAVRNGDAHPYRMVGAQSDITERKLAEERLRHDALHDALTGLPNRVLFLDRLRHRIEVSRRRKDPRFAVFFLDLDRFKVVNDSLGHQAGDQLLVEVTQRIETTLRPSDTIARLGGDEFAVLLEDVTDAGQAARIAERVLASLKEPFRIGEQEVVSGASIGIALSETNYEKAEDVLRDADTAMYRAKSQGRGRHEVFDGAMHKQALLELQLESELRRAVERNELLAYYMPIVSLETGRVEGFEALVRWKHPEKGLIPPAHFIPVAEVAGLVIEIDRWVMREACKQLKIWQDRYQRPELVVSVNLSGKQFRHPDLPDVIGKAVADAGLSRNSLAVEITESVLIDSAEEATQMLAKIREFGVRTYLDDFGTGYSSLSYLQRFPIDAVKIDRSFVSRMSGRKEGREIVRAIVVLSQSLGLLTVAEGVEKDSHLALLRELKCTYGQGSLFAMPLPVADAEAMLTGEPRW
jgi:diguanylate cyclase (GGDEF)-like protein/PAS domain S-box-containing protein